MPNPPTPDSRVNWRPPGREQPRDEERWKFDEFAHAVTVIQEQHRILHDGFYHVCTGKDTGWLDAGVKVFQLKTAALNFPHIQTMLLNFGKGDVDFVAYEGATITVDGTPLPVFNANRNSTKTPLLELFAAPTVGANGTEIFRLWTPPTATGVGQSANGIAGVGQGSEWILKPSTDYLVIMTNNSGATIDFSYEFSWYELAYDPPQ